MIGYDSRTGHGLSKMAWDYILLSFQGWLVCLWDIHSILWRYARLFARTISSIAVIKASDADLREPPLAHMMLTLCWISHRRAQRVCFFLAVIGKQLVLRVRRIHWKTFLISALSHSALVHLQHHLLHQSQKTHLHTTLPLASQLSTSTRLLVFNLPTDRAMYDV